MEVYLARESKISRLLELEADVEKLSRTNLRSIAQIQRLETERNEIAQKLFKKFSKVRTSRSAPEPDYNLLDSDALENEKELLLRKIAQVDAILRQKREGKPEISSPSTFDFSFLQPAEAIHARIHLRRACDGRAAMILVNPAIHPVAQAHAKQSLGRQRCGQQFGSWREGG
jgi:hypothetical protein